MGPADGPGAGLGQAVVPDLARRNELGQRPGDLLDWRFRVNPVLVVQVDVIRAKATERAFDRGADGRRARVEAPLTTRMGDRAELRGQHHLTPAALDGTANKFLVDVRPVGLGGVDERNAQVEGAVDGADRLVVVEVRGPVEAGHRHRAEADPTDIQGSEGGVPHDSVPFVDGGTIDVVPRSLRGEP